MKAKDYRHETILMDVLVVNSMEAAAIRRFDQLQPGGCKIDANRDKNEERERKNFHSSDSSSCTFAA
jgi:hypothetical protein